jgi:N utilization substance protein B
MSNKRSQARHLALQALYQWQVAGQDLGDIESQFLEEQEPNSFDLEMFRDFLHRIPTQVSALDALVEPLLDRPLSQVDPVERAILRIGTFELKEHLEIPYAVVINEAVELAKVFGAEQGHRYVNGVLDKLSRRLRPAEAAARRRRPG